MTLRPTLALLACLAACGTDDSGPTPLGEVSGKLGKIAVNATSLFAIDTTDGSLVEIGLDGKLIGKLETFGAVTEVAAAGDLVAWVETEGTKKNVRRRKAGMIDTLSTFAPHVAVTTEGVFYSDTGIIGAWLTDVPDRIGTPAGDATLLGVDTGYAYTLEAGNSVKRYDRHMGTSEAVIPSSLGATVKDGMLAYRTADGVRIHDLAGPFDHAFGMPPADYTCDLLIAGRAVMCGKYRCLDEVTEELLEDPIAGYASAARDIYWLKTGSGKTSIYKTDAEMVIK